MGADCQELPPTLSELDHICSGFSISNLRLIVIDESIEDLQNLIASVTLCQQGEHHLLRHNDQLSVSEL